MARQISTEFLLFDKFILTRVDGIKFPDALQEFQQLKYVLFLASINITDVQYTTRGMISIFSFSLLNLLPFNIKHITELAKSETLREEEPSNTF
jgi:hypothetical protein